VTDALSRGVRVTAWFEPLNDREATGYRFLHFPDSLAPLLLGRVGDMLRAHDDTTIVLIGMRLRAGFVLGGAKDMR